ncbi:MAG: precorrin-3B C(17)-methyltransferase, partial [Nitrosopumilaceae archaeon]|nr:precorrin-3B C(17)-methyltransferase [Nitrosopumilaceae archaeon]MBA4459017.1 precorrin-3B C(17)-methyltransferase [Nitrosopumilaceae archaeon]
MTGKLNIVGVGPGNNNHMTFRAKEIISESDIIIGYETYVNLVSELIEGKTVYRYAMTQEVERAHQCIDLAKSGKIVSLVSSGDPGIYGMAGLIYETLAESGWDPKDGLQVEVVPGVSALNSCASIVGSPLMSDFAVVSMSDLLVPWEVIENRVESAAKGDFVLVIYNPASKKRVHQLQDTRKILLKYRKPTTPVAIIV